MRQRNEHTIAHHCQVVGRGYWSGKRVRVRMLPASLGTGICFVRTDLPDKPLLRVGIDARVDQDLRTNLAIGSARFSMVEHLLAALYALEIDNVVVEINAEELPGLDGSSVAYVDALRSAGLVIQASCREQLIIDRTVRVGNAASWVEVTPTSDGLAHYAYELDYGPGCPILPQRYEAALNCTDFCRGIAPARTFVTADQAAELRRRGVAEHVTMQELLVFDDQGPVENRLRFENECARHKVLDMIGDLALVGCDFVGKFTSYRGGHALNAALARKLAKMARDGLESQRRRAA